MIDHYVELVIIQKKSTNKLTSIISEHSMGPSLKIKIQMLKEAKLELLGRAIQGADVARELEHVEGKLSNYGRLQRFNKKVRKKYK